MYFLHITQNAETILTVVEMRFYAPNLTAGLSQDIVNVVKRSPFPTTMCSQFIDALQQLPSTWKLHI